MMVVNHAVHEGDAVRVLVVEDDRFNRQLYRDLLEAEGLTVDDASTALAGLRAIEAEVPNLVVMDIQLPGMDGLAALRVLRARRNTVDLPVLVVSAHPPDDRVVAALVAGRTEFMQKPLSFPDFQAAVQRLLGDA